MTSSLAQDDEGKRSASFERFSHGSGAVPALETFGRKPFSSLRSEKFVLRRSVCA